MKLEQESFRSAEIVALIPPEDGGADTAFRLELSFSSEEPYLRYSDELEGYFHEVLGHREGEVDFSRLLSGAAPLLIDHDARVSSQVGVVERAWLEGGQGRAVVRFAKTPDAEAVRQMVEDGILTTVSVGYRRLVVEETGETRDGKPVWRVTRWLPYEVSFVAIPADPTVGVGRAATDGTSTIDIQTLETEEGTNMSDDNLTTDQNRGATPAVVDAPDLDAIRAEAAAKATKDALAQSAEMDAYAERFGLPADFVRKAKADAISLDSFRERALEIVEERHATPTDTGATRIGMRAEEVADWSLFNAVRYLLNPTTKNEKAAGFELECSRAFADKSGKEPGGVFIPDEVLLDGNFGQRTQVAGTSADGGALVPVTHMSGSFIDMLRVQMITARLGARVMSGLSGDIDIPKRTGGATIYFVDEDEDMTESKGSFGTVPLVPHTIGAETGMTRRMILNGSPDIEALVRDDLLQSVAIGVDTAVLVGGFGAKAPTSLRDRLLAAGTPTEPQVAFGTSGEPSFAEAVALETAVDTSNALTGNLAYAFGAQIAGHLKTTPKFAGGEIPIMGESGTVNGYRSERSNIIPAGEKMFGNWGDLLIGYWSGFDLRVDTAQEAKKDNKVLRVFLDFDSNVRHLESFALGR